MTRDIAGSWARVARAGLPAILLATLAGCGGGGGGDSGPPPLPDVTLVQDTQATWTATSSTGRSFDMQRITGHATGDVSKLSGRTLYVQLSGANGLVDPAPRILANSSGNFQVEIDGTTLATAGDYTGQIAVTACFDVACTQPLKGSPVTLPYRLKVLQDLVAPTTPVSAQTTFGKLSTGADIPFTPPSNLVGNVRAYVPFAVTRAPSTAAFEGFKPSATVSSTTGQGNIHVDFGAGSVGVFKSTVVISADWTGPAGQQLTSFQQFDVQYTIAADPSVDLWMTGSGDVSIPQGQVLVDFTGGQYALYLPDGTSPAITGTGTTYLTAPAAAAGKTLLHSWHELVPELANVVCINTTDCLPAGTYTAVDHYHYTKNGTTVNYDVPVTLTITP